MQKFYFTFGQAHTHNLSGRTYDKDCFVEIEAESSHEARDKMFEIFGRAWGFQYDKMPSKEVFPRGLIPLP